MHISRCSYLISANKFELRPGVPSLLLRGAILDLNHRLPVPRHRAEGRQQVPLHRRHQGPEDAGEHQDQRRVGHYLHCDQLQRYM